MILKYYTWNKIDKTWNDMKAYCSVCTSKTTNKANLTEHIHHILTKRNLISLPRTCLSLVDRSQHYIASYHLFAAIGGKNINFGKLEEIPNKNSGFNQKKNIYVPYNVFEEINRPIRINYRFALDEMIMNRAAEPAPAAAPIPDLIPAIPVAPIPQRGRGRVINPAAEIQVAEDFYQYDDDLQFH